MKRRAVAWPELPPHLYAGRACHRGHAGLRYRTTRGCIVCVREAASAAREKERAEEVYINELNDESDATYVA
jgi:hypothetical protein